MRRDELILDLSENTRLTKLTIDPDFDNYNELVQRVVVFVLLHGDITVDGTELTLLSATATTGAATAIKRALSSMESKVISSINAEVPEADTANRIRTLSMSVEAVDRVFKLVVNIETEAGTIITGAADING